MGLGTQIHFPVSRDLPLSYFQSGASGDAVVHGVGQQHFDHIRRHCFPPTVLEGITHCGMGGGK